MGRTLKLVKMKRMVFFKTQVRLGYPPPSLNVRDQNLKYRPGLRLTAPPVNRITVMRTAV
jgi:hypothetical protein